MVEQKEIFRMLDLMVQPGFCVKENKIAKVNKAAEGLFLTAGMEIGPLFVTGSQEYAAFTGGCLHLTLSFSGHSRGASVTRMGGWDIFVLDDESSMAELRSMALAARELRKPMDNLMTIADQLSARKDPALAEEAARLNRGLYQMLRILSNMSDASRYSAVSHPETLEIGGVFQEIFEKAQVLAANTGITLTYEGLTETIYCLADAEQLERAVLNILSNALKFTPKGGSVHAALTRRGRMLRFSIQDTGSGIAENVLANIFRRYQRQPSIEDQRFGIGLGMVLIRSAAAHHGGTVLIDQPNGTGTRITMTLSIRQNESNTLRSNALRIDYAGERDHGLVELSDVLPAELYRSDP